MQCPECDKTLSDKSFNDKKLKFCNDCRGFWLPYLEQSSFIKYITTNEAILSKFENAVVPEYHKLPGGFCPECNIAMESKEFLTSPVPVLECEQCCGIWLQTAQIGPLLAANKLGLLNLQFIYRKKSEGTVFSSEGNIIKSFLGWIEDDIPLRNFPYVTWALIAVNTMIFLLELFMMQEDFLKLAYVPNAFFENPLTNWYMPVTSMFMHGGFAHLIGNMIFLKLFGDNIEDRIGPLKFLVLYLLLGIASGFGYAWVYAHSAIPMVGASGAISGIMGCSLVLYPKSKLKFHRMFFFKPYVISLSVWVYVGIWFVLQQLAGIALDMQGVAFLVHLLGLGFGGTLMLAMKQFDML